MSFPRRLLTGGENVVVELRPHWTCLGRSLPVAAVAVAGLLTATVAWSSAPAWVGDALLVVVGICLAWLAVRTLWWRTTALVVTTQRVIQRSGVLARRGSDVRLDRINEISYHQSLPGRVVGTGQLVIEIGGETGLVVIDHVRRPAAVAGLLHEQIAALRAPRRAASWAGNEARTLRSSPDDTPPAGNQLGDLRSVGSPVDPAGTSAAQQLVELDELRRRGILTEDEFRRKKAELLDRM